jgi:hypothetical protein
MGKKPFIDRKNAKHFQLVHRSQRDPLINDNEASSRVLVEVVPPNLRVMFFLIQMKNKRKFFKNNFFLMKGQTNC